MPRIELIMTPTGGWQADLLTGFAAEAMEHVDWQVHVAMLTGPGRPAMVPGPVDAFISSADPADLADLVAGHDAVGISIYAGTGLAGNARLTAITPDWDQIADAAVDHLIRCGLRRLTFVHVGAHRWTAEVWDRLQARCQVDDIELHDLPCPAGRANDWRKHLARQLPELVHPCGIIAEAILAGPCTAVCAEQGIGVPEQMAILALENNALYEAMSKTPLTTIDLSGLAAGRVCAERLSRWFSDRIFDPTPVRLPPLGLSARRSTELTAIDDEALAYALAIIARNLTDPPDITDLAAQVGVSRRTLEQRFRTHLGRSPLAEINRLRMEHAKHLLQTTKERVAEIGVACGFADPGQFSRDFRRIVGLTPSQWRRAIP